VLDHNSSDKIKSETIQAIGENGTIALEYDGNAKICIGVASDEEFGKEHNPVVMAELKGQLVCCQQLLQLEPDSKCMPLFFLQKTGI